MPEVNTYQHDNRGPRGTPVRSFMQGTWNLVQSHKMVNASSSVVRTCALGPGLHHPTVRGAGGVLNARGS